MLNLLNQIGNLGLKVMLRSPFHGLVSNKVMLITFTGRKSGRVYTTPVNYVWEGDLLQVVSLRNRIWWRNLRGGAPVSVHLQGQAVKGWGEAIEGEADVAAAPTTYLQKVPNYAKYFDAALEAQGQPNAEDVALAAQARVMVQIRLNQTRMNHLSFVPLRVRMLSCQTLHKRLAVGQRS